MGVADFCSSLFHSLILFSMEILFIFAYCSGLLDKEALELVDITVCFKNLFSLIELFIYSNKINTNTHTHTYPFTHVPTPTYLHTHTPTKTHCNGSMVYCCLKGWPTDSMLVTLIVGISRVLGGRWRRPIAYRCSVSCKKCQTIKIEH